MPKTPSRRLFAPIALACVAMALPASAAASAPCANANVMPVATNGAKVSAATLCLINRERTSRGLRALRHDRQLRKVAGRYSRQMVRDSFFDHVGPNGSTVRSRISGGTSYLKRSATWSVGENLYWGSGDLATPRQSVQGWMHSPGHRRNMLDRRFQDIGVGIAIGAPEDVEGAPSATYATEFGARTFRK
jgi:uncharacterized protein YkwD